MTKELTLTDYEFNPDIILASGQVFRMYREDNIYTALSGCNEIKFYRTGMNKYEFFCADNQWDFWMNYFDFQTDYSIMNNAIEKSDDTFLKKALERSCGMRILRQDLWETFISYIVSQNNNIPKIKKSLKTLCDRYSDGYAFPSAEVLAFVPTEELESGTALGYRAAYISEFSQKIITRELSLDDFVGLDYETAIQMLTSIKGIGPKVANCIALYGLHIMDAYPIDTWMKKIISEDYSHMNMTEYMNYLHSSYAGFEGYVQQLQFYHKRQIK